MPSSAARPARAYGASGPPADADAMAAARLSGGHMVTLRPATDDIWGWLDLVPDPEIPVISVVDLGIVRDVAWEGDTLVVTVTPTYSGCPATAVISMDIEAALQGARHRKAEARDAKSRRPGPPIGSAKRAARGWRNSASPRPIPRAGPSAAPAAARPTSNGSASSVPPPARRNGAAATAWNPSTISSASEVSPRARFTTSP
jgi:ring-1,2-phenylacetyl-CoA epoxidase subunit PaaD